jgi:hypothetical protein
MPILTVLAYFCMLIAKRPLVAYLLWLVANLIGVFTTEAKIYFAINSIFCIYGVLTNIKKKK